ncbi:hypothetical protein DL767_009912 [Monosporascus sp. MG133]|nr:hypothetical protein DL767_009912 [Monosporascus sp. MG133]
MSGPETLSVHRTGFTQLSGPDSPQRDDSTNGNPSMGPGVFWPRDYLTEDIPEARVWTYGYNADVVRGMFQADNQNSVSQHGQDLATHFKRDIENEGFQEPTIFVAHSLGGIIVKDVVSDFSSKVGLPEQLETVERIDANHMQMARCSDKTDQQYRVISKVLTQFIRTGLPHGGEAGAQGLTPAAGMETDRAAASGNTRAPLGNRASRPYYIPLPRNRHFTGRDAILDRLQERLFIRKDCQKLAVVGLGGVGKTQVALKFAYWAKDNQPAYSVFWVPALSDGSFDQAYAEIARRLEIRIDKDDDPKKSLQRHLSSEAAGKWLLIVDNADDAELLFGSSEKPGGLHEYLPESENGITLFTTRSRKVAVSAAGCDVFDLQEMDEQEATSFLEKTLIQKQPLQDEAITRRLLQDLTYLPLAITQAVAYLNCNQTPIEDYLELLRGTEEDMVSLMSREFRDSTRYSGSQNAVASTWLVSFDQVRKFDSAAAELLSFMSCIEPKAIPRSLLPNSWSNEEMEIWCMWRRERGSGDMAAYRKSR